MALFGIRGAATSPNEIAKGAVVDHYGGRTAAVVSAIALAFSGYSLWETSLKQPHLKVFVPAVMQYSSPEQNTNFEVFALPVTITNEGARTGTILGMELVAHNLKTGETKRFYAADFGRWTMERTRSGAYEPFAPLSLAGRSSRTESVLFYTRGEQETVQQIVKSEPGSFIFTLRLDEASSEDFGVIDRIWPKNPVEVTFKRELKYYDARAFNTGTLPLYSADWTSASNTETVPPQP